MTDDWEGTFTDSLRLARQSYPCLNPWLPGMDLDGERRGQNLPRLRNQS
jgi:hypothetical protein